MVNGWKEAGNIIFLRKKKHKEADHIESGGIAAGAKRYHCESGCYGNVGKT